MWLHESSRTIGRDNWLVVEQDNHTEHLISPSPTTRATWRGSHSSCTHSASFHGSPLYCNAASPTVSLAYLSRFYTPQQKWCRTCSYSTASIKTGCLLWSSVRRQSKICTYKGPQRKKKQGTSTHDFSHDAASVFANQEKQNKSWSSFSTRSGSLVGSPGVDIFINLIPWPPATDHFSTRYCQQQESRNRVLHILPKVVTHVYDDASMLVQTK